MEDKITRDSDLPFDTCILLYLFGYLILCHQPASHERRKLFLNRTPKIRGSAEKALFSSLFSLYLQWGKNKEFLAKANNIIFDLAMRLLCSCSHSARVSLVVFARLWPWDRFPNSLDSLNAARSPETEFVILCCRLGI